MFIVLEISSARVEVKLCMVVVKVCFMYDLKGHDFLFSIVSRRVFEGTTS